MRPTGIALALSALLLAPAAGRASPLDDAGQANGLATYVAMSRMHDNVHYLSDVDFGAAVGEISGRTITRHGPKNFALMPMIVPGGGGVALVRLHPDAHEAVKGS